MAEEMHRLLTIRNDLDSNPGYPVFDRLAIETGVFDVRQNNVRREPAARNIEELRIFVKQALDDLIDFDKDILK